MNGQRFGRWTVLSFDGIRGRFRCWICRCDCGTERSIRGSRLKSGESQSCGCISRERMTLINTKHGDSFDPLYAVWSSMKVRCSNRNFIHFKDYGGRGISVCDRWLKYENFRDDMSPRYRSGLTLERRDNNAGYSPDNCYWATSLQQGRNKRNNIYVDTPIGNLTIAEAARAAGISWRAMMNRVENGWSSKNLLISRQDLQRTG